MHPHPPLAQRLKSEAASSRALSGFRVVLEGERAYEKAREISNSRFSHKPMAIAFPRAAEHVAQCIRFCQDNNIELRVRSGGHQHEGMCSGHGVLMVRLSEMNQIHWTDGTRRTAWIDTGARLEDVYQELARYNKIIAGGGCRGVNVGGLTLGGGWGLSARPFGLACDNVLEVEVVLADGRIVHATKDNAFKDLFWALLGSGGGNFGIVTRFRFRLHNIAPAVSAYKVYWSGDQREAVIRRWLEYQREEQSLKTTSYLVLYADLEGGHRYKKPPVYAGGKSYRKQEDLMKEVYEWTHGIQPTQGPEFTEQLPQAQDQGQQKLSSGETNFEFDYLGWLQVDHPIHSKKPLTLSEKTQQDEDLASRCRVPYPSENCLAPHPHKVTSTFPLYPNCAKKNQYEEKLARVISDFIRKHPVEKWVKSYISLYSMGGAVSSIEAEASAFWYRDRPFVIQIESWWNYPEQDEYSCRHEQPWQQPYIDWVQDFRQTLQSEELIEGAFINFFDKSLDLKEYYGGNFERLTQAKKRWDPTNFFRFEKSIP